MFLRLFCLSILVTLSGFAQSNTNRVVLQTSTILDGKGGVLRNQQIVIEGSRILSVQAGTLPATYDLRGLTLMPGWIDTHVHLNWHFDAEHKLVNRGDTPQSSALYAAENAWLTLEGGFTTVQSLGAQIDLDVRDRIKLGSLPGPRILTSVRQITDQSGTPDAIRSWSGRPRLRARTSSNFLPPKAWARAVDRV